MCQSVTYNRAHDPHGVITRALREAGIAVTLEAYCSWCAGPLPDPEDRTVTMHPACAARAAGASDEFEAIAVAEYDGDA